MKRLMVRIMRQPKPEPGPALTSPEEREALRARHIEVERRLALLRALGEHFGP